MVQLTAQVPAWSPWGSVQTFEPVGDAGILHVQTAAHDGYFLPPEVNALVHEDWRIRTGWYGRGTRDSHWSVVALSFPTLFDAALVHRARELQRGLDPLRLARLTPTGAVGTDPLPRTAETNRTDSRGRSNLPGRESPSDLPSRENRSELPSRNARPGISSSPTAPRPPEPPAPQNDDAPLKTVPRRKHAQFHPQGPVATSVWADWHETVPAGFVGVCAAPDHDPSARSWHLVPAAEYEQREAFRFVVDPERHRTWDGHPEQ